ncbi:MAG: DUF971 domain-containing protein [Dehalococcoidia bacterium]
MTQGASVTPRNVGPDASGSLLEVEWQDDHVSAFVPRHLRLICPCAGCVDEMTGQRTLRPEMVPEDTYLEEINYVGRYALAFRWSDGHSTGIYPFQYLRDNCPCEACQG